MRIEKDILIRLGRRIREEREGRGLAQETLAAEAGLKYQYLADVEKGRRNLSVSALAGIAKGLGMALPALLATEGGQEAAPTNDKTRIGTREFVRSTRLAGASLARDASGRIAQGRLLNEIHHWKPQDLRLARNVLQAVRRWTGRRTA